MVTEAKTHDLQVAKTLRLGPGYLLIFDRAYLDYSWLNRRHGRNVSFVTRLKRNSRDSVVATHKESDDRVLADPLQLPQGWDGYPENLRRIVYHDSGSGKTYDFLINRFNLTTLQSAELYRQRWQFELFFKWIKQDLKIKAFFGTYRNAVLIQIWMPLIDYILLIWLKLKSIADFDLLELS